jgi:hypothetical protein
MSMTGSSIHSFSLTSLDPAMDILFQVDEAEVEMSVGLPIGVRFEVSANPLC